MYPRDCRCGDDANVIKSLDERACNYPCLGDPKHGMCGSICPAEGPGIANVYTKTESGSPLPQTETVQTTSTFAAPVTSINSADCTTEDQEPVTQRRGGGFNTPAGPAPEIPTTFTFVFTSSGPGTIATSSAIPPVPTGPTTSCSEEQSSATELPTVAPASSTCEEDPATISQSPAVPAPYGTTTASPPMYSSEAKSVPSPSPYSDPVTSEQDQDPAATASSVSDPTQDVPGSSSTGTLWSRPSGLVDPTGQAPVPAQVPGSDSTHSIVPPLATIGGLVLFAAIIM